MNLLNYKKFAGKPNVEKKLQKVHTLLRGEKEFLELL